MKKISPTLDRRSFLRLAGSAAAGLAMFEGMAGRARAQSTAPMADKLLFVISCAGGASIVDSFMAVRDSEVTSDPASLLCFPDAFVSEDAQTGLRALDLPQNYRSLLGGLIPGNGYQQSTFRDRYKNDLAVMTMEGTSVNHIVAQKRAMNGFGIHNDRTLLEATAERYGQSLLLPNINMTGGGYLEEGADPSLPERARQEVVSDARFFSLSTDGLRGIIGAPGAAAQSAPLADDGTLARARALMSKARGVRELIDDESTFGRTFRCAPLRKKLLERRRGVNLSMEQEALITNLTLLAENDLPDILSLPPLSTYGLAPSPETEDVRRTFDPVGLEGLSPGTRIFVDSFLAQAVLAFLLARYGLSCATAFGPQLTADINTLDVNPPLSFDFSHNSHVATQNIMWSRVLDVVDKLIGLLQATDAGDGTTMWDRSVIYLATDFGRDKVRNSAGQPLDSTGAVSTGHHLNNGVVILSPNVRGGVYGGVDRSSLLTHGFDRATGVAAPGTKMREGDVYSAVTQALGVDFPGRIDLPCMRRA